MNKYTDKQFYEDIKKRMVPLMKKIQTLKQYEIIDMLMNDTRTVGKLIWAWYHA